MGSLDYLGVLAPQLLGLEAYDASKKTVCGGQRHSVMPPQADPEWHSISLDDSARQEYCFKLVERKDGLETCGSMFGSQQMGSKDASSEARKLEFSLCGLSKFLDSNSESGESRSLTTYPDGLRKDVSYITMESLDSSNGVKEVRVSFHGLDDSRKESSTGKGSNQAGGNHDLYGDDGCFSLLGQFRAMISGVKQTCGGLLSGDGKHSVLDGLHSLMHSCKASDSSTTALNAKIELERETIKQAEYKSAPGVGKTKAPNGCRETPKRGIFEARDPQSRSDALPLAHYRPDGPVWCQRESDPISPPSVANSNSAPQINCKKPPKPPKPPRHPGRSASLDSASLAAQRLVAAKKRQKQAQARRKARAQNPQNSGGAPFIALALTLGFGVLMVFQGLFVQSNVSYGNSDRAFVDVPTEQFSDVSGEKVDSYGHPYQIDQLTSLPQTGVQGTADAEISSAFHRAMQEIQQPRDNPGSELPMTSV